MKKTTRNLLTVLICLVFLLFAVASGEDADSANTDTSRTEQSETVSNENGDAEKEQSEEESTPAAPLIEEMTLLDQGGVLIKATAIEDGIMGTEIKLILENNSDEPITVQTREFSVNGIMIDALMSADVVAGKKAADEITIYSEGLKSAGIEQIANIEFYFHVFNTDTWNDIFDSELIKINTSAAEAYVQEYDTSGEVLYDNNGIKIVYQGLDEDGFMGPELLLYIENNSGENVTLQTKDTSINGFMVEPIFSCEVVPGKKAYDGLLFMNSTLDDSSIDTIEEVEFIFHVFNTETWNDIFDSEVIKITVE